MKKIDAVVLGRQILQTREGADKRVFLQFKITNEGDGAGVTHSIYCTTWFAKISRLYEILLTWAEVHDFPIILEPGDSLVAFDNPISWQQLQTTMPGEMHDLMDLFPIFIRRSYNQSRVFTSWTKGTYPCIEKSTDKKAVEALNFHNKYVRTTISLKLRSYNFRLNFGELETILLFALGKFGTVEVILHSILELNVLYNTISRVNFE